MPSDKTAPAGHKCPLYHAVFAGDFRSGSPASIVPPITSVGAPFHLPRQENLWVPPVSWRCGRPGNIIGKPHCFNDLHVSHNMLRPVFWSPVEPSWNFKVTPLPAPKVILRVAVGWRPLSPR